MENKYEKMTPEELEAHLSNFLVGSWSYSAVTEFARNEKAFERSYIYCERDKDSASSVAGSAYHAALEAYFTAIKDKQPVPDVIAMQAVAYAQVNVEALSTIK